MKEHSMSHRSKTVSFFIVVVLMHSGFTQPGERIKSSQQGVKERLALASSLLVMGSAALAYVTVKEYRNHPNNKQLQELNTDCLDQIIRLQDYLEPNNSTPQDKKPLLLVYQNSLQPFVNTNEPKMTMAAIALVDDCIAFGNNYYHPNDGDKQKALEELAKIQITLQLRVTDFLEQGPRYERRFKTACLLFGIGSVGSLVSGLFTR